MAQPASLIEQRVLQVVTHRPEEPIEHREGESRAGWAIGRRGDVERGEVPQVGARGIAIDPLDKKQLGRGHGIETPVSPRIADVLTGAQDRGGLKLGGPLLLELFHHLGEGCGHR